MRPVVEMKGITKKFGDLTANDNINLTIMPGEIHALLGENGAGKTTLMNILYGLYSPTAGDIFINDKKVVIDNPNTAIRLRIGMVHQHFMLVPPFTVMENIVLGSEPQKMGFLQKQRIEQEVREISNRYGLKIDPHAKIEDISVGMQQRVEILKALYRGADILILDEPTAVLTPQEINELINILKNLISKGKSIILITHKLKEIMAAAHRVTVIRRGKVVDTLNVKDTTPDELAAKMVGRQVSLKLDKQDTQPGETVLKINNLQVENNRGLSAVKGVKLEIRQGEILGLAGVDGNGQTELVEAITGLRKVKDGKIMFNGQDITNWKPRKIFEASMGHIPEDRQKRGLVLDFTVADNMVLQTYYKSDFAQNFMLNHKKIATHAQKLIKEFDVRPPHATASARGLSGGNQQKVIVAREISHDPDLLIAAQPTRGLDVGAIEFIHKRLLEQRSQGKALLLFSLELDEIMNLSDRIAVMYDGKIIGIVKASETNEEQLGLMMAGNLPETVKGGHGDNAAPAN